MNDSGTSAVEYGLMIAAIAAVIVGIIFALGPLVSAALDEGCGSVQSGVTSGKDTSCP